MINMPEWLKKTKPNKKPISFEVMTNQQRIDKGLEKAFDCIPPESFKDMQIKDSMKIVVEQNIKMWLDSTTRENVFDFVRNNLDYPGHVIHIVINNYFYDRFNK